MVLESQLKHKSDLHLARKIAHISGVLFMLAIYTFTSPRTTWIVLLCCAGFIIPLDILRQKYPALNKTTLKIFGAILRKSESSSMSGMSFLYLGAIFLLLFFDKHIISLTMLFLAFGDPIASYFGIRFGKDKIVNNKTLQGSIAAFATCTLISAVYYYANNIMLERLLIVAPLSGVIGAVAELIPIGKLDDNLTFPALCSVMLWLLFQVFGGFSG